MLLHYAECANERIQPSIIFHNNEPNNKFWIIIPLKYKEIEKKDY